MTPRRILAWHFTARDLLELARLSLLGALLVAPSNNKRRWTLIAKSA